MPQGAFLDCRCFNPLPLTRGSKRRDICDECFLTSFASSSSSSSSFFPLSLPIRLPHVSSSCLFPSLRRRAPQEYVKGADLSIAPEAGALQLAQHFYSQYGDVSTLPSIPLWVLIQPAYECLSPSVQSPVASPKSSPKSPISSVAGTTRRGGASKMPAVSFLT